MPCHIAYTWSMNSACLWQLKHKRLECARSFGWAMRQSLLILVILQLLELFQNVGVGKLFGPRLAACIIDTLLEDTLQGYVLLPRIHEIGACMLGDKQGDWFLRQGPILNDHDTPMLECEHAATD